MFETTHLECSDDGTLRLKLTTAWASVTDAVDFDFGTVSDPFWPDELGQEPDWFFGEAMWLWNERQSWLASGRGAA